jgi:hypothetical protein
MRSTIEQRSEAATVAAKELVELIKPVFAGLEPEIVGAVLGQLLAILVAGHCPEMRDEALKMVTDMVGDLVPIEVEILIDAGQVSAEWRGT